MYIALQDRSRLVATSSVLSADVSVAAEDEQALALVTFHYYLMQSPQIVGEIKLLYDRLLAHLQS
jgi:hypothetical protein